MVRPLDETELIARAKRGDRDAYEELVRMHQGVAFRTAYVVAGNVEDAQEAAQDAFVKAFRALGRFRTGAPFRPWLLRIVTNEARNRGRSARRRETLTLRVATSARSPDVAPSLDTTVVAHEQRAALLTAVNRLEEPHRLAIVCRYFLDLSERETAEALDCRRGTVKSRLSRALERLRSELEVDGA